MTESNHYMSHFISWFHYITIQLFFLYKDVAIIGILGGIELFRNANFDITAKTNTRT